MQESNSVIEQIRPKALFGSALIGALIGFGLMALFVFTVDSPKPEWGELWEIRPLVVTTIATLMGGIMFYLIHLYFNVQGWNRILAFILAGFVFFISFWMGSVLGLDGTLWN